MKTEKVNIKEVIPNKSNPRIIKDSKFKKLVKSIKDFPQMLELRPIVVDENNIILGGNMRFKACIEAGLKEVFIIKANDLTEEQKHEFIVKDNVGFGEWDWDILANEWDTEKLEDWGLNIPIFIEDEDIDFDNINSNEDRNSDKQNKVVTCPKCLHKFDV
jgi:ParB-like chromosome segregation protein Spo0J